MRRRRKGGGKVGDGLRNHLKGQDRVWTSCFREGNRGLIIIQRVGKGKKAGKRKPFTTHFPEEKLKIFAYASTMCVSDNHYKGTSAI